ncbi:ABC transporter ATP-binding protein [Acidicapsa ligni]|uniref:ABC transporter ATP-binding protein n=1 Tax=Acidicapsa ligni TaxID=542300 RepID=UPI0021E01BDC|nr:ABC transporter ATP-binding protein [Acidicapsa ligni]
MASSIHAANTANTTEAIGSDAPLLEITDLHVWFGAVEVVRGVSLSLHRGEVLGLVGESGSGKSVTSLAILGLLNPAARVAGSIRWQGRELLGADVASLSASQRAALRAIRGREIAMIFQEPMTALNPVMTVGRQLTEAILVHSKVSGRSAKAHAISAMEAVAIPEAAGRYGDYPHQFSGGQRQRILIAMALVHKPQLLIADEPTTALDVTVQAQVLDLLKDLQREHGVAMLFTSHDLAVVGQMANRVAVMRYGQVLESGSAVQVLAEAQHPYTRSLLGAVPTLRTDRNLPLATLASSGIRDAGPLLETVPGHWVRQSK